MKRFYSLILLVSFLVGVVQPILPMVEYQLYEGNVAELFDSGEHLVEHFNDGILFCIQKTAKSQQDNSDSDLLDEDFYPIAVDITPVPAPLVFPNKTNLYLPSIGNKLDPTFCPFLRPPG